MVNEVNEKITYDNLRVIDDDGTQIGIVDRNEALNRAFEKDLDLLLVSDKGEYPVARILNYSKYKYEQQKKEKKKKSPKQTTKEIKFRPVTDINDLNRKIKDTDKFLQDGMKVKVACTLKGREKSANREDARNKIQHLVDSIENGSVEGDVKEQEGFVSVSLVPKKSKS